MIFIKRGRLRNCFRTKGILAFFVTILLHTLSFLSAEAALIDTGIIGFIGAPPKLYSSCIFGYESSDLSNMIETFPITLTISPIGEKCSKLCDDECYSAFDLPSKNVISKLVQPNNDSKTREKINKSIDVNAELINACIRQCQSGGLFNAKKLQPITDFKSFSTKAFEEENKVVTTNKGCAIRSNNPISVSSGGGAFYDAKFTLYPNERIIAYLYGANDDPQNNNTNQENENTIYMCGEKIVRIYPSFYSTLSQDWKDNSVKCVGSLAESDDECRKAEHWNARNSRFTDTNIYVRDGDYLSITYEGRYHFKFRDNVVVLADGDHVVQLRNPKDGNKIYNLHGNLLAPSKDIDIRVIGLKGQLLEISEPSVFIKDMSNIKLAMDPLAQYSSFRKHIFRGIVSGYSNVYAPLQIRHYDEVRGSSWSDNLGGFNVSIIWKGCRYKNGERLQYALVPKNKSSKDVTEMLEGDKIWNDAVWQRPGGEQVLSFYVENQNIKEGASFFFRIKPLSKDEIGKIGLDIKESYSQSGSYSLSVKRQDALPKCGGFISGYIKDIYSSLFESFEGNEGIVVQFFKTLTKNGLVISFIRILLAMYIAYTGLSFIVGLSQITQKDAVVRITKISIVLALIQPYSWDLFNKHFFIFFTQGVAEIIDKLTYAGLENKASACAAIPTIGNNFVSSYHPPAIIDNFDLILRQLFNDIFWQKFLAIIFSGLVGFIIGILILVGVFLFCVCIIKVIIMYVISLYCIGLLIIISPFVISCLLFSYTKKIFDAWVKQLFAFALEPILVMSAIWLFQKLNMILMQVVLNFTMCKVCLLNFNIPPFFNICILSIYRPIIAAHSPSFFSIPIMNVAEAVCFFIISSAMFRLSTLMSDITKHIVSFTAATLENNAVSQKLNSFNQLEENPFAYLKKRGSDIVGALGLDSTNVDAMKKMRASKIEEEKKRIDSKVKEDKSTIDRREGRFDKIGDQKVQETRSLSQNIKNQSLQQSGEKSGEKAPENGINNRIEGDNEIKGRMIKDESEIDGKKAVLGVENVVNEGANVGLENRKNDDIGIKAIEKEEEKKGDNDLKIPSNKDGE